MTDIQNVNEELQQEALTEDTNVAETVAETTAPIFEEEAAEVAGNEADTDENKKFTSLATKQEVIDRLKAIAEGEEPISRLEVEALKSNFYRIHKQETEEAYKAFIENGGNPEEYLPAANVDEPLFKEQMAVIKEKRTAQFQEQERQKEENYQKKLDIIEKVKAILANPDEVNKSYNDFKALQQEWNEIKNVPAEKATDLWKTYQVYVEQFYDTLKLNNEFRAYDFKKNLELKTALCESAEKLAEETDVISAFRKLQQLHQEFREIGPVATELREEIWTRFKDASTVVNKRHQDHFEKRKEEEQNNLDQKTALCEAVEAIDLDSITSFNDWNAKTEEITAMQANWKTIGYAPQKMNVKIFERFRAACDKFFQAKTEYYKSVKEGLNNNLQLKKELCEKAEALADSTDWKATADALVELQKQWKAIGAVPKKYSDSLWERFRAACDKFFDAKKEANSTQHNEQTDNLEKKRAIVERLAAINPEEVEGDLRTLLRSAQEEWNAIGHVPFKEKDVVYKALREQMDRLYGALSASAAQRRINRFKNEVNDTDGKVRERLVRQFDILKNEIKTYENNLGFLTLSSKSGNGLVDELNRKVEKLKADLVEIKAKIAALDEKKQGN
jgi:hypothetical protein